MKLYERIVILALLLSLTFVGLAFYYPPLQEWSPVEWDGFHEVLWERIIIDV